MDEARTREITDLFSASRVILDTLAQETEESIEPAVKKNYFIVEREEPDDWIMIRENNLDMRGSYEDDNGRLEKGVGYSNRKMLDSTQKLFSTVKKTDYETKKLLKAATQSLSHEDVKLMGKCYFI